VGKPSKQMAGKPAKRIAGKSAVAHKKRRQDTGGRARLRRVNRQWHKVVEEAPSPAYAKATAGKPSPLPLKAGEG
jgi:hypothetical protein